MLDIAIATASGASQLVANTLIIFTVKGVTNPSTLSQSSSFQVETLTSDKLYRINQRTLGLTVTNSLRGAISTATARPESTALGALTAYTITFTPTNPLPQNAFIQVGIPEEISVQTGTTPVTCTSVTLIESTLTCSFEAANRIVTITRGFLTQTSYAAGPISFKISGLKNPETALTTRSFTIETKDRDGVSIDYVGTGVTYTKLCDAPCATCSGSLSNCTSCYSTSEFSLLHLNT